MMMKTMTPKMIAERSCKPHDTLFCEPLRRYDNLDSYYLYLSISGFGRWEHSRGVILQGWCVEWDWFSVAGRRELLCDSQVSKVDEWNMNGASGHSLSNFLNHFFVAHAILLHSLFFFF